jgi:hypothetical protein
MMEWKDGCRWNKRMKGGWEEAGERCKDGYKWNTSLKGGWKEAGVRG